ncbi:hypothetical protein LQ51_12335, partial [Micromonospora sp. HK10]
VRLNPLTVLVSVLLAAELAGLLGALLAIPAAGVGQILLREFAPAGRRTLPPPAPDRPRDQTPAPGRPRHPARRPPAPGGALSQEPPGGAPSQEPPPAGG